MRSLIGATYLTTPRFVVLRITHGTDYLRNDVATEKKIPILKNTAEPSFHPFYLRKEYPVAANRVCLSVEEKVSLHPLV
jgi:hypothetical protein